MPNLPNSFIEAWVVPNHIRFTSIDVTPSYPYDDIPDHLVTFTYNSSEFIGTISDYELLENIALNLLETISGDIQIVIDVTGKNERWSLIWEIHIYNQLNDFWRITRLGKRASYSIPESIDNNKGIIQKIQARNTDILR